MYRGFNVARSSKKSQVGSRSYVFTREVPEVEDDIKIKIIVDKNGTDVLDAPLPNDKQVYDNFAELIKNAWDISKRIRQGISFEQIEQEFGIDIDMEEDEYYEYQKKKLESY